MPRPRPIGAPYPGIIMLPPGPPMPWIGPARPRGAPMPGTIPRPATFPVDSLIMCIRTGVSTPSKKRKLKRKKRDTKANPFAATHKVKRSSNMLWRYTHDQPTNTKNKKQKTLAKPVANASIPRRCNVRPHENNPQPRKTRLCPRQRLLVDSFKWTAKKMKRTENQTTYQCQGLRQPHARDCQLMVVGLRR